MTAPGESRVTRLLERVLARVERAGNLLPHPATLFVLLCAAMVAVSWVLVMAGVTVQHPATGKVKVEKLTLVMDAGTIVSPDGARAQVEGSALWGMSLALFEGTEIRNGQVKDTNLGAYTPLRMADVPEIEIVFQRGVCSLQ